MKRVLSIASCFVLAFTSLSLPALVGAGGGGMPSCGADGMPIAIAVASDYKGMTPHEVQFDASYSLGCGDQITDYQWNFGDGVTATGMTATHVFETAGTWNVSLQIIDEASQSDSDTRTVTTRSSNQAPSASDDSYVFTNDSNSSEHYLSVRTNDTDAEGDYFTQTAVTQPSHGSLRVTGNYGFYYTAEAGYYGQDSFTYQLTDDFGGVSNTATVTIDNMRPIVTPTANNDSVVTDEDQPISFDVYSNDSDDSPLTTTPAIVTSPSNGTLQSNGGGSFTYTPKANFNGQDAFVYRITDTDGQTAQASVSIVINSVYDPIPVNAANDGFTTNEDASLTGSVVTNDITDPENSIEVSLATGPSHGNLQLNTDGTFSYTPDANYYGNDSFTYRVTDNLGSTDVATVSLTIKSVNDSPVADFSYNTTNKPREYTFTNLSSDPENNSLSYSWSFGNGATSSVVSPTFRYNQRGTYTVTLTVTDTSGATTTLSRSITAR